MTNPNNEDEADEIVRRLKMPPTRRVKSRWTIDNIDILTDELAAAIAEEIDKEILEQIRGEYEKTILHGSGKLRGKIHVTTTRLE